LPVLGIGKRGSGAQSGEEGAESQHGSEAEGAAERAPGGWVPPKKSTSRNLLHMLRTHWLLVSITVLSLILAAILRSQYAEHTEGTWPSIRGIAIDIGLAASGALVVALVVGFLIDVEARYGLAKEIAEGWLWGLLGQDAPESLQLRAKEVIGNRIVLNLNEAVVSFDWAEPTASGERVLHVQVRSLAMGTNFGPEAWRDQPTTRVIPSLPGRTSRVTHWEWEVQHVDASMPAGHFVLSGDSLQPKSFEGRGTIHLVEGGDLDIPADLAAHRGDRFRLLREAEFWLLESDTLPVSSRAPSVETRLIVTGPAAPDLDIHVLTSRFEKGPMAGEATPNGDLLFQGGARLSGEWWWLCWTPKSSVETKPAEDGLNGDRERPLQLEANQ
jgi:hypothetical protein